MQLHKENGQVYLGLHTVKRKNITESRADSRRLKSELHYSDSKANTGAELGKQAFDFPPSSLALRAEWREYSRTWEFFYGIDGAEATVPIPGGKFVEDFYPSPDGKLNMIYIHQAKEDANTADLKSGFSVALDGYQLLQY